ncbi:putative 6-phosphogluconolactonase [Heracleum sosnowskyi]|uniref:6-phosphogluconolactonase n=1 Tax=Heracleum sosnowskyi TaxID=360622 RepID=A0AAD8IZG6_9APIA|nr:putative 6-phosphogluconolactonase [Heracleum sosnowskyi]
MHRRLSEKPGNSVDVKYSGTTMRTQNVIQKKFPSEEEVSMELAKYVIYLSHKCIKANDSFTVVLSGGTLIYTMRKLVEKPNADCIDWSKWFVFWLDERVVSLDDPDSNYKLAYDGFLSKVPIPDCNIFAIDDELSPEEAAEEYEARLRLLVDNKTIGKQVAHAVKVALASQASNFIPLPVEQVSPEGNLTWFLDKDALSQISNIHDHSRNRLTFRLGFVLLIIACVLYYFPCIDMVLPWLKHQ